MTGRNPITGEYLSGRISFPNKLVVQVFKNQEYIDWDILTVKLLDDDKPLWYEHPQFGKKVDVAIVPVTIPDHLLVSPIENMIEPHNEKTEIEVRSDVFILGYPFGVKGGGGFPIWKRASIASEPVIDIDDLPKIYVDTASRPGMSGSPVLYKEKRAIAMGNSEGIVSRYYNKIVGVYSGRIGAEDELKAQLGIVWKFSVIEDILKHCP